jgi:hypothetical protein
MEVTSYHIPEAIIIKAYEAHKNAPLPGVDAMATAIREIKGDLWNLITEDYESLKEIYP